MTLRLLRGLRGTCGAGLVACGLLTGGCATTSPALRCHPGESVAIHDLLYFGADRPTGVVSSAEWTAFVADVVTPRFPDGFTAWDATGQWRDPRNGNIVREPTRVVSVVHADDAASERGAVEIAAAYRARFDQQGVFRVRSVGCSQDLEDAR